MNIDALSAADAAKLLRACCGSTRWVERMIAARPFGSVARMKEQADRIWSGLARDDWIEAFRHHPRIGGNKAQVAQNAKGASWSRQEQSKVAEADAEVGAELARVNEEYERRFGYIYLVSAAGKTAEELVAIARRRLSNDPATEIRVAAEEQRKIMQLRLARLLETT
jgi:OHCU decarboxylase